jgi:DNA-binding SARP family transcriptional activator
MRFCLLGPLRVMAADPGEPRAVSAPRLRALLAALLWRANQPVPLDELAEMVWDGAPPNGAQEAIRALVMRLRRQLDKRAAARIVTRTPGYVVEVSPNEVDAQRFEMLTLDSGTAIRDGEWAQAAQTSALALALWRGAPLADVPSQLLHDQWVPRLQQLHLQALEWRIEADLHEGRHERLIPELRELTARHPHREHLHSQLMLALVRSGRQAEALDAFQSARFALADELGIDPGDELRQLHGRILAQDPALIASSTTELAWPAPVPHQLPPAVRSFVGRQVEFGALGCLMEQASRASATAGGALITVIDGMAGVGKTALAVQAAHQLAGLCPDGQLFIDLHGYTQGTAPRPSGEALDWLLRVLGFSPQQVPADIDQRAALFRQRLAGTKTLIVLDNVVSEAQVRPLLPSSPGCLVLVTSRRRLKSLDDAHVLTLDVLPPADAMSLFRTAAGHGRIAADDPVLPEIVELCGQLPLALRIAGGLLRHRPAWTPKYLTGLLRIPQGRIEVLSDGDRDMGTALDLSYRSLSDIGQLTFGLVGLIPGPDFDSHATAALTGIDAGTAVRVLEDLLDHNLLIQDVPGRYRMHDMVRLHALALASRDPVPGREAALGRLLDYYRQRPTAPPLLSLDVRDLPQSPASPRV